MKYQTMILFHQYVYLNAFQCITSPPSMKGTINAVINDQVRHFYTVG